MIILLFNLLVINEKCIIAYAGAIAQVLDMPASFCKAIFSWKAI